MRRNHRTIIYIYIYIYIYTYIYIYISYIIYICTWNYYIRLTGGFGVYAMFGPTQQLVTGSVSLYPVAVDYSWSQCWQFTWTLYSQNRGSHGHPREMSWQNMTMTIYSSCIHIIHMLAQLDGLGRLHSFLGDASQESLYKRMGRIFSQFWRRNMVENDTNATTVLLDSWLISLFTRWIRSSDGHMSLQMHSLNGSSRRDISFPQPSAIIRKVVNPVCWLQRLSTLN